MIKLKLNLEDLAVDSFDTAGRGGRKGTVLGHETDYGTCGNSNAATCANMGCVGTEYTDCFGICGAETEGGGLSCGCETQDCTGNPHEFRCINSQNFCFETQQESCGLNC